MNIPHIYDCETIPDYSPYESDKKKIRKKILKLTKSDIVAIMNKMIIFRENTSIVDVNESKQLEELRTLNTEESGDYQKIIEMMNTPNVTVMKAERKKEKHGVERGADKYADIFKDVDFTSDGVLRLIKNVLKKKTREIAIMHKNIGKMSNPIWFNDEVLDVAFSRIIKMHDTNDNFFIYRSYSLNGYLDKKWNKTGSTLKNTEEFQYGTLSAYFNSNIFLRRYIGIPINKNNDHWVLVVLDLNMLRAHYYDSMSFFESEEKIRITKILIHLWASLENCKHGEYRIPHPRFWSICFESVPKQTDDFSCGPFTCVFFEHVVRGIPIPAEISRDELNNYTRRLLLREKDYIKEETEVTDGSQSSGTPGFRMVSQED